MGVVTHQCKTMKNAIELVFTINHHRWYLWRTMKKVPEKLRGYGEYKRIKYTMNERSNYKQLFNNASILQNNSLLEEVSPHLMTDQANSLLTTLPSIEEIYNATFSLKKDSVVGPYGFDPISTKPTGV